MVGTMAFMRVNHPRAAGFFYGFWNFDWLPIFRIYFAELFSDICLIWLMVSSFSNFYFTFFFEKDNWFFWKIINEFKFLKNIFTKRIIKYEKDTYFHLKKMFLKSIPKINFLKIQPKRFFSFSEEITFFTNTN